MDSRLLRQRTGASGRVGALFLLLAAAALSVILLRPVCETAFGHAPLGQQHSAACCESVADGSELDLADLAPPTPGAKFLGASFAYPIGVAFIARAAVIFADAFPPNRSFYSRSARILR